MTGSALQSPVPDAQTPTLHWSSKDEQSTAVPAWQLPAPSQSSAPLQASPSLQEAPAPTGSVAQVTVAASQKPALQASPALEQSVAAPLPQLPSPSQTASDRQRGVRRITVAK